MTDRVFVTGASGFIAKHIVLELTRDGVAVRGSVRSPAKAEEVRDILRRERVDPGLFEPVALDLTGDDGWENAARGCRFLLHTASPFPARQPRGKFDLVPTARDGTLRALRAAKSTGCERAVVTSSVAAVFYGYPNDDSLVFDERNFSRVESDAISPYAVSKTMAEEAAWDFSRESGLPLATINPTLVFGPLLDATMGTSARLLDLMARGLVPILPHVAFGIADVRDVARAHIKAMRCPDAVGRRFIVSGGDRTLRAVASVARAAASRRRGIAPLPLPSWIVRMAARVSPAASMLAAEVDRAKRLDLRPLREVLDIQPRSPDVAIRDLVHSIEMYKKR